MVELLAEHRKLALERFDLGLADARVDPWTRWVVSCSCDRLLELLRFDLRAPVLVLATDRQETFLRSPRLGACERGGQFGHISLEALYDRARVALDLLDVGDTSLANCSLDRAPDPGADGHPVGVRKSLHLLDRLGREPHWNVLRQRPLGPPTRRAWCRLALRRILVVLEGLRVAHARESPS